MSIFKISIPVVGKKKDEVAEKTLLQKNSYSFEEFFAELQTLNGDHLVTSKDVAQDERASNEPAQEEGVTDQHPNIKHDPRIYARSKRVLVEGFLKHLQEQTTILMMRNRNNATAKTDQADIGVQDKLTIPSMNNGKFLALATLSGINTIGTSFNASNALLGLIPGISSIAITTGASIVAAGGLLLFAGFELKKIAEEFGLRLADLNDLISEHLKYQLAIQACFHQAIMLHTAFYQNLRYLNTLERQAWLKYLDEINLLLTYLTTELKMLRQQYNHLLTNYTKPQLATRFLISGVFGFIFILNGLYAGATFGMSCCHVNSFVALFATHPLVIGIVLGCALLFGLGALASFAFLERAGAMELVDRLFGRPRDKIQTFIQSNEENLTATLTDKRVLIAEKSQNLAWAKAYQEQARVTKILRKQGLFPYSGRNKFDDLHSTASCNSKITKRTIFNHRMLLHTVVN